MRLGSPAFRLLWGTNLLTNMAMLFFTYSANVVMVTVVHASAFEVGLLDAVTYVGTLGFGFVAGTWIDRWGYRRTLVGSTVVRTVALALIPTLYLAGVLDPAQIIGAAVVVSICDVFFQTAHTSILPGVVGRERIADASARLQSTDQVWRLVGPGAAGQLTKVLLAPLIPVLGVVAEAASAVLVLRLPADGPRPRKEEREPFRESVAAGLRFIVGHGTIRRLLTAAALNNLAGGLYGAVMATFILRALSISPSTYGLLMSLGAVGGVVSSLLAGRIGRALGPLRAVFVSACVIPLGFVVLVVASRLPTPSLGVGASEVIFSFAVVLYSVQTAGMNARLIPVDLMARVTSSRRMISLGAAAVGALAGSILADLTSLSVPLWIAVAAAAAQLIPLLRTGAPRRRDVTDE